MQRPTLLGLLAVLALAACGAHCLRPLIRAPRGVETTGRYIAVLKESTTRERLIEIVEHFRDASDGCKVYGYMEAMKAITLQLSDGALQKVRNIPEVKYVEEEGFAYAAGSESVGGDRWYLDRLDQLSPSLDSSYEPLSGGGEGVDVYVLDSGIDFQHDEFGYRAKYAGFDPVDQYEYQQGTESYVPKHGADCHGHGTAVASLVGGETYGTARKANLFSVRVLRCDSSAPWSIVLDGLNFIAETIPKRSQNSIVLLALSGSHSTAVNDAIETLYRQDVVVVTAAGNGGVDACLKSPASSPFAITVGATDKQDNITSNYGSCVNLFAPGEGIMAANSQCDSCTGVMSGSTLSAGLTAGVAAAYFSQMPHLTPAQIRDKLLLQSVRDVLNFAAIPETFQPQTPNVLLNLMCGGRVKVSSDEQGVLQSLGFPGNYPSNLNCKWTLVAEGKSDNVLINFAYIKLEKNYDMLTLCLEDKCSEQGNVTLTGDFGETECMLRSRGSSVTIWMDTDSFTESPGFTATYTALPSSTEWEDYKCLSNPPVVKSSVQLDVLSAGYNVGNRFAMKKDWREIFAGRRHGINLAVLDEVSGSVLTTASFDTNISHEFSNQLAETIEQIRPGRIVMAAVSDEGTNSVNIRAKHALMSVGSDKINKLTYQGSWALIGVKGAPQGHVIEKFLSSAPVRLSAQVHLKSFHKHGIEISAESAGLGAGNYATISVDGTAVDIPYTGYKRGLNVVILDKGSGIVVHTEIFHTSAETTVYSPSDAFVNLIMSQPEGALIVVAIKDEGVDHLSEAAKQACESIGSALIRQVGHGGSWAIVGRKGAPTGSVPESASNSGSSKSTLFLPPSNTNDGLCPVTLQSSGHPGIGARITVNEAHHISPLSHGITLAVLSDSECVVEKSQTFTSSQSNGLVDFINLVPPGRVVLASIASDGVQHLTDSGKAALEAIGSAIIRNVMYQHAWAIIGKKGAPRGSVLEQSHQFSTALGASITLAAVHTPFVSIQSAGLLVGNYAKFEVNGEPISITYINNHGRGLNLAVINETNMNIIYKQNYDTHASSAHSRSFVDLVNSLPIGSIVAIAMKDAATNQLSEAAKRAIEGLGSKYIRQINYRGSWALIGRKGAPQGTVLEAACNNGPTEIITQALPVPQVHDSTACEIFVESAGGGSPGGLQLSINGNTSSMPAHRGIRVVVIEEDRCAVESTNTYDTHSSPAYSTQLARLIASVPTGRIIVASVFDEAAEQLQENAKLSLESIGSSLIRNIGRRDAWAIVGRKGAAMGSVPESSVRSVSHEGSTAVAVGGSMELSQPCRDELYPLDCLLSGTQ